MDKDGPDNQLSLPLFAMEAKRVGELQSRYRSKGHYSLLNDHDYVGEYRDGQMHGHGTYTFASGEQYEGEWRDGDHYVGEWRDNKQNGQGTLFAADGFQFIGEWKDDSPDGKCAFIKPDGEKEVAVIRDFQIIEEE